MPRLLLVPESIPLLCQLLMAGVATAYVLSVPKKSRATWWLVATLCFSGCFSLSYFLLVSVEGGVTWEFRLSLALYLSILLSVLSGALLAYTFLAQPYRREYRVVRGVSLAVALVMAVWTGWCALHPTLPRLLPLFSAYGVLLVVGSLWTLAVLARKGALFRRLARERADQAARRRRVSRAHGILFGLTGVLLIVAVVNLLVTEGVLPPVTLQYVALVGQLVFDLGLIISFINYAPEPTTAQAKIVGVGLATVLLFLGLTSLQVLRPEELAEEAGNTLPARLAVRAEPIPGGGYRVVERPFRAYHEDEATPLQFDGDTVSVALPFPFEFGGSRYTRLYTYSSPVVTFSPITEELGWTEALAHPAPKLLPFILPSRDRAMVTHESRDDRVVFTWRQRDVRGRTTQHQLALFPDGAFEILYAGPEQHTFLGGAGFDPGPGPLVHARMPEALPRRVAAGAALIDDYGERYRALAHQRSLRFALLILLATLFILLLFPRFLRSTLLRPLSRMLEGAQALAQGHRDIRVPVYSNDEFGSLGRAFNRMAASVQSAEGALVAYAQTLEARVAERTNDLEQSNTELEAQRSELEQSLRELERAQAQLVQAEKLASLGRLTAGIAHEIKNPLNFVNNFALLNVELADELEDKASALGPDTDGLREIARDLRQNADKIAEHGRRADHIVQGMLLHARGASGERTPTDLNGLLRLAADGARGAYARNNGERPCRFNLDLDDAVGTVPVVSEAIVQVVINLLENAFYAAEQVSSPADAEAPRVDLVSRRRGDHIEIEVTDTGVGMSAETQARVFEPFFTTKPPGEGTGLGLSLAYDIVTKGHDGSIAVESTEGVGTRFVVRLPAA